MDAAAVVLDVIILVLLAAVLALAVLGRTRAGSPVELAPVRDDVRAVGGELRTGLSTQRTELQAALGGVQDRLDARLAATASAQEQRFDADRAARRQSEAALHDALQKAVTGLADRLDGQARAQAAWQQELADGIRTQLAELREENGRALEKIRETVDEKLRESLAASLKQNGDRITQLNTDLQQVLRAELDKMRTGNEEKLEKMRATVDEKLQGTLEKRLGESFALVSERLEQVQKGLGEMQTLASDVGGLKRVLTNVKNRGSWGEVQLQRQLEDILTASQYDENVAIRPGDTERVEFAVRLPGRDDDGTPVYLPIDSKFPQEDYERLLQAQEDGDKTAVDAASRELEKVVLAQAKLISSKYIQPPYSTDFAVMYLPTEGLFAEVVRRPGLAARLQREQRVMVTGPTTLMSLLNSLQVGFRSLAIEKRSSEVWQVLSAAKAEFHKYGDVWDKLGKQLETAQRTVKDAGVRTRAVERKLRDVEVLEPVTSDAAGDVSALLEPAAADVAGDVASLLEAGGSGEG